MKNQASKGIALLVLLSILLQQPCSLFAQSAEAGVAVAQAIDFLVPFMIFAFFGLIIQVVNIAVINKYLNVVSVIIGLAILGVAMIGTRATGAGPLPIFVAILSMLTFYARYRKTNKQEIKASPEENI